MPQKTLGPFTGKQLTVMICTLMVLLLFPVGAWAVSGSNVFVTDASSGARGRVDAKGGQNVGVHDPVSGKGAIVDGKGNQNVGVHDPVSGKGAGVDSSGALKVNAVTGNVTANVAPPAKFFSTGAFAEAIAVTPEVGDAMIATGLQISWSATDVGSSPEVIGFLASTDCNNVVQFVFLADLPDARNFRTVDLQPGIAIPNGLALCIGVGQGTITLWSNVTGYIVPAASVPTPATAAPLATSVRLKARPKVLIAR